MRRIGSVNSEGVILIINVLLGLLSHNADNSMMV